MRALLSPALLLAALAVAAPAQNLFEIYPSCTTHASRGTLGVSAGEVLLQIPASHTIGVGHDPLGTSCRAAGVRIVTQDQDASTQETFQIVLRPDLAGQPDCTVAGLLFSTGPLPLPTGLGVTAWVISVTFAAPLPIPQCETFYPGVHLAAAPTWPLDGQSMHIARYATASNASANVVNLAWDCVLNTPAQPTPPRTIHFGLLVESAVLAMGNTDAAGTRCMGTGPDFGVGGMWPVCEGTAGTLRNDALVARVRDDTLPTGLAVVFAWPVTACPSFLPWPIVDGAWYLAPGLSGIPIGFGLLAGGEATIPTALTSGVVSANKALLSLPMYYQAVVVQGGLLHATNRAGTIFGPP